LYMIGNALIQTQHYVTVNLTHNT